MHIISINFDNPELSSLPCIEVRFQAHGLSISRIAAMVVMDFTFDLLPHTASPISREQIVRIFICKLHVRVHFFIGELLFLAFAANNLDPTFLCPYHSLNLFAITEKKNRFTIVIFRVGSSLNGLEGRILDSGLKIYGVTVQPAAQVDQAMESFTL